MFNLVKKAVFGVGLALLSFVAFAKVNVNDPLQVEAFVDGAVESLRLKEHVSSGAVFIMKDGRVLLSKGYGYQDYDANIPVDPATSVFRMASVSKLLTWLSVMQLVEQGKIDLDTDVNTYLKAFQIEDTFPGKPITLRHIMTHTSGVEDFGLQVVNVASLDQTLPLAQSVEYFRPARVYPPGEHVAYSNWATSLAGYIVEVVSGESYYDYIEKHFLQPLGMKNTTYREPYPESMQSNMVTPYQYQEGKFNEYGFEYHTNFAPSGAMSSTIHDMAILAQVLLNKGHYNGVSVLKKETFQRMLDEGFTQDERLRGMGLGLVKRHYGPEGLNVYGHGGATHFSLSHLGVSEQQNFIMITVFSSNEGAMPLHMALIDPLYEAFFPLPEKHLSAPEDFASRAQKYLGTYISSRTNYTLMSSLVLRGLANFKVALTEDNSLLIRNMRFVEVDENLFEQVDGPNKVAFQVDGHDRVTGLVFDGRQTSELIPARFWDTTEYMLFVWGLVLAWSLVVVIRYFPNQKRLVSLPNASVWALRSCALVAACHIAFSVLFALPLTGSFIALIQQIPAPMRASLIFPLLSLPATAYLAYTTYQVWTLKLYLNGWARVKHTLYLVVALLMLSFYYSWNLFGFQYYSV